MVSPFVVIIIIIFLHGLGQLTCSGIDALPLFPGASTISSSSRFVVEGVFRESGVTHSFKMVDPVLFVFASHVLYNPRLCVFAYEYFIFLGRVTNPSAKPPFLEDQFVSLSLAYLLRPVRLRLKYKQKWINHLKRIDNTRLPKHALNYKPRRRRDRGRPRKRWQCVDAPTGQTT